MNPAQALNILGTQYWLNCFLFEDSFRVNERHQWSQVIFYMYFLLRLSKERECLVLGLIDLRPNARSPPHLLYSIRYAS